MRTILRMHLGACSGVSEPRWCGCAHRHSGGPAVGSACTPVGQDRAGECAPTGCLADNARDILPAAISRVRDRSARLLLHSLELSGLDSAGNTTAPPLLPSESPVPHPAPRARRMLARRGAPR